jgi:autophagy-related protein 27
VVRNVIAIAGDLREQGGHDLDFKVERLGKEASQATSTITDTRSSIPEPTATSKAEAEDRRGLRLVLGGGLFPLERGGVEQRAVVDFVCDNDKSGLEGEWEPEDEYESARMRSRARRQDAAAPAGEKQLLKDGAALLFDGYGPGEGKDKDVRVLKLTWRTKEACNGKRDDGGDRDDGGKDDDGRGTTHWGFFTWFVVM